MDFNKYNSGKQNTTTTITTGGNDSGNDNNTPSRGDGGSTGTRGDSDRVLWGVEDDGGDLDSSMQIRGNLYIRNESGDDEGDSDSDGKDDEWEPVKRLVEEEYDTDGNLLVEGSTYVKNNIEVDKTATIKDSATITNNLNVGKRTSTKELYLDGVDIMEYFKQHNIHIAYADSEDGSTNFIKHTTTANPDKYKYLGLHVGKDVSDAALTRSDYKWIKMVGGDGAPIYGLLPVTEWAKVKDSDNLQVSMQYKVMKIANGAISVLEAEEFAAEGLTMVYLAGGATENMMTNNDHLIVSAFMSNWSKSSLDEFTIRLKKDGNIVDQRIVPIIYDAKGAISDHNRIVALENKPDKDTIYDDTAIKARITALENKPDKDTIYDDTDLKNRVTALENKESEGGNSKVVSAIKDLDDKVTNGRYGHPIILWSGRLYRLGSDSNQTSYTSWHTTSYCSHADFGSPSITIKDGLMTLSLSPFNEAKLNVTSVNVNQYRAFDTQDLSWTNIGNRNEGAHFFEARTDAPTNTTKIYIREFHNADSNNDSWDSNSWVNNNGVNSIFVTIFGYVTPKESSSGGLGNLGCGCEEDITDLKTRVTALENKPDKDTIYDDTDLKNRVTALENNSSTSPGQGSATPKTVVIDASIDETQTVWEIDVDQDMVVFLLNKETTRACRIRMSDNTTIPNGRKITFVNTKIVSTPWKISRTGDVFRTYSYSSSTYQRNGFNKSEVLTDDQYVNLDWMHNATLMYCDGTWYQIAD